jgi:ParB-like chromosome segregation protein Spo0J
MKVPAHRVYLRNTQLEANPSCQKQSNIYKKVLKSLSETPQINPLLVVKNGDKYKVVCGNNRYLAGKELGFKEFFIEVLPDEEIPTIQEAMLRYKQINLNK